MIIAIVVILFLSTLTLSFMVHGLYKSERIIKAEKGKYYRLFLLAARWGYRNRYGFCVADGLLEKNINTVAIYGMDVLGLTLFKELTDSGITVCYGIDRNANGIFCEIDVVSPDEELERVDAVIVTAVAAFDDIRQMLMKKMDCVILSLEDLVYA